MQNFTPTDQVYPPIQSDHPPSDPSTDIDWRFYTDKERQMLIDTPIEDMA